MMRVRDGSCGPTGRTPEWFAGVFALHAAARGGALDPAGSRLYRDVRDDLLQVLLVGQQIMREFGHSARESVRMARALQVDLGSPEGKMRASTLDISTGGFSVLFGKAPAVGLEMTFSLRLPGSNPVSGAARVVASIVRASDVRVSFEFTQIAADAREQLGIFIFDALLNHLAHGLARPARAPPERESGALSAGEAPPFGQRTLSVDVPPGPQAAACAVG